LKSNDLWSDPQKACRRLLKLKKAHYVLYYELAPTGNVHPGILRTFIRMNAVRNLLINEGAKVSSLLRINDRYILKSIKYPPNISKYIDNQLKDAPSPVEGFRNFFEWSKTDIENVIKLFDIKIDTTYLVSEMYKSEKFKKLIEKVILKKKKILEILSESQKSEPQIFHPICSNCKKMYHLTVSELNSRGEGRYICKNCGNQSKFSVYKNPGLLAFKIETALTWKFFNISMDFHGLNHVEAVKCSKKIFKELFDSEPPLSYVVNLTLGRDHKMASKSHCNFKPITKMSIAQREELLNILSSTPDQELLSLPKRLLSK